MKRLILFIVLLILAQPALAAPDSYVRIGLFVGENYGLATDTPLRYAAQDARRIFKVMSELGSLSQRRSRLLVDCERDDIILTLSEMDDAIRNLKEDGAKIIFFFYYSGHADDDTLHINGEQLPLNYLKESLARLNADILFGIFDTCQSGAITKIKGGLKGQPFSIQLVEQADMVGSVYLTSSMAEEVSHESEAYSSSLFTYYLVSALRGAADYNDDKRISLTEAYKYAYLNTLKSSSETTGIVQHPNFQYNLRGKGELILSYLPSSPVHIIFPESASGNYFISSEDTNELFVEVRAKEGQKTRISLPRGSYLVKKKRQNDLLFARANLRWGGDFIVDENSMKSVQLTAVRQKGTPIFIQKNSIFFLTANGSGIYEGMASLPQFGLGYSRFFRRYELGFSLSYDEQEFNYEDRYPSNFISYHESLFLRQRISYFPWRQFVSPVIGVSAHAFQATIDSGDINYEDTNSETYHNMLKSHPLNGFGFGLLTGLNFSLPNDVKVALQYELQVIWADYWADEKSSLWSDNDNIMLCGTPNDQLSLGIDPIHIIKDPQKRQQNVARHQFTLMLSYYF